MKYTKISIKINSDDKPPYFIGSQIRGAFGYALKSVNESLFEEFYLKKNETHSYRFDIRLALVSYEFSFYLFDKFCDDIFEIICAFRQMLTKVGLTKEHKVYNNFEIYVNDKLVFKDNSLQIIQNYTKKFSISKYKKDIILRFETPLRIKKNNIFIRDSSLELKDVLNSIYQRKQKIKNKEFVKFPYQINEKIKSKNIYFKDLTRKSNLQNSTMQLGGIMGEMWVSDLSKENYELLKLGELIGVGKSTTFGLGKINIGGIK